MYCDSPPASDMRNLTATNQTAQRANQTFGPYQRRFEDGRSGLRDSARLTEQSDRL
jgi:hypothetical protein